MPELSIQRALLGIADAALSNGAPSPGFRAARDQKEPVR